MAIPPIDFLREMRQRHLVPLADGCVLLRKRVLTPVTGGPPGQPSGQPNLYLFRRFSENYSTCVRPAGRASH